MLPSVAIQFVADELEGDELVFDPEATRKGITQTEYDRYRLLARKAQQSVGNITDAEAYTIYDGNYWSVMQCSKLPDGVDLVVFQMGVNVGTGRAVRILQQVLGVDADGIMGPNTLAAVATAKPADLVERLLRAQADYYNGLANSNIARNGGYIKGWLNRVTKVRLFLATGLSETGAFSIGGAGIALVLLLLFVLVRR